ncbi:MAG: type IV conjugative transfer system protein TraE [Comamonadaceae bacterium]|nr:type IV conjugative transfer system protein TraE [Comamonadaceae bacterium]
MRRTNATTYFLPQQLLADEHNQSVVVLGRLRTQVNGSDTSDREQGLPGAVRLCAGGASIFRPSRRLPYDRQSRLQALLTTALLAR